MISVLFLLLAADTVEFYADPVVYRSTLEIQDTITYTTRTEDIFYLELNCGIPYHELDYETSDSLIIAKAVIVFLLTNLERPDSIIDTLYRQFTIPSFSQAAQQQLTFLVQFGLHIPAGLYRYAVTITSGDKSGSVANDITINVENYHMSDLLLAESIAYDTASAYLRKGDLRVVPHPSHVFNERYSRVYVYYEIYDIEPDSGNLLIHYIVTDNTGAVVSQIPRYVDKKYKSQAKNFGLSLQDFEAGRYILTVKVSDEDDFIAQKQIAFEIRKTVKKEISYEGLPYYDKIEYFLTPKEYKAYKEYSAEGKKYFLDKFWRQNDYYEVAKRFEDADEKYKQGTKSGHETDRGRIYVKYGRPDEIAVHTLQHEESRPYEHWQYYNGDEFIFVDPHGTSEYLLVWTNVDDELSQPTLYKYLPRSVREQIRY